MSTGPILVADVGGTNARFALAMREGARYRLIHRAHLAAIDFPSIEDAVAAFLKEAPQTPQLGCFAAAGPPINNVVDLTNSNWIVDGDALARRFKLSHLHVVNDFAGQARGAALVEDKDATTILPGAFDASAPQAILGPGTGLGLAFLLPGQPPKVLPSEGGHSAFAPQSEREAAIHAQIAKRHGYVSYERVVSGIGIATVWQAIHDDAGMPTPALTPAEIVSRRDKDAKAAETLDLFFSALGVFAGNAVLIGGARGGVHLGGGILPRLIEPLLASSFVARFKERGPMSAYVADVPVRLMRSDDTALLGAAALAEELG
jgi:glucokinase